MLLRFKKIKIAADGTYAVRLKIRKIDSQNPAFSQSRFNPLLITILIWRCVANHRFFVYKPHNAVRMTGHIAFKRRNNDNFGLKPVFELGYKHGFFVFRIFGEHPVGNDRLFF